MEPTDGTARRLQVPKYREIVRKLRVLGWSFDRHAAGSHEIWRHVASGRKTTVPHHPKDMAEGTLRAILREGQVEVEEFLRV